MPNTFIENRDRWMALSEIDYLGQFVKVWLAYNAWYRSAYSETTDRKIMNEFKWQPNPILNKVRPLLMSSTEEGLQLRADIGLLHHRLENYELQCGKGPEKQRITFKSIYLRDTAQVVKNGTSWGYSFTVELQGGNKVRAEVKDRKGAACLVYIQPRYDLADLEAQVAFVQLTLNLQSYLRQLYQQVNPQWFADLTKGDQPITCGAYEFRCGRDVLFAGVVEALYLMRCTLFHGELVPTKEAAACYEPAYRLVRKFIECIS